MNGTVPRAVGIVIPAHDEVDHITATIESVLASIDHVASGALARDRATVVVVADACSDDTARVARAALGGRGSVVEVEARCVGTARALGSTVAVELLDTAPGSIWLAHTDADSTVPTTWLQRQLEVAGGGVDCVAGVVGLADGSGHLREAFHTTYGTRVGVRRHDHVHGANLGIRADVLEDLGGWSVLVTGEDHDLWDRAGRAGAIRRTDTGLVVLTSARTLGRAPRGFARDLRRLAVGLTVVASAAGCVRHPGLPATGTSGYQAKASSTVESAISNVATVHLGLDAEAKGHTTKRYLASVVSDQEDRLEEVVSSFSAVSPPTAAARSLRPQVIDALDSAVDHVASVRIALDAGDSDGALALRPALAADADALEQFES